MTMSYSDAGRLARASQIQAKIDELAQRYRPKEIASYNENGKQVRVFQTGYAVGSRYGG